MSRPIEFESWEKYRKVSASYAAPEYSRIIYEFHMSFMVSFVASGPQIGSMPQVAAAAASLAPGSTGAAQSHLPGHGNPDVIAMSSTYTQYNMV